MNDFYLMVVMPITALLIFFGLVLSPVDNVPPGDDWNIMDWPLVGQAKHGAELTIDKRQSGDSTAYSVVNWSRARIEAVEVRIGTRCFSGDYGPEGFYFIEHVGQSPCVGFGVAETAYEAGGGDE